MTPDEFKKLYQCEIEQDPWCELSILQLKIIEKSKNYDIADRKRAKRIRLMKEEE